MNPRLGIFALATLGIAACSTSGTTTSNTNPLAGVTIQTATPPPSPTPSPVPTATPTPAPNATQAIADSGFESGAFGNGWKACSIPHAVPSSTASPVPALTSNYGAIVVSPTTTPFAIYGASSPTPVQPSIHTGTYAALTYTGTYAEVDYENAGAKTGNVEGADGVCQTITLPTSGSLSMYVNEGGSESGLNYGDQEADLISSSGAQTNLFYELNTTTYNSPGAGSYNAGSYVQRGPYALTSAPYNLTAGQQYTLFVGTFDTDPGTGYGEYMFVDDVTLTGTVPASSARGAGTLTRTRKLPF